MLGFGDDYDYQRDAVSMAANYSAYQWGPRIGSRFIPGVGTAILAYQAAPFAYGIAEWGYNKYTGGDLNETMVGKALVTTGSYIDAGVGKAQRLTLDGLSGTLGFFGYKDAAKKTSDFASWYLQDDAGNPYEGDPKTNIFAESEDRAITQDNLPIAKFPQHMSLKDQAILKKIRSGAEKEGSYITMDDAFKAQSPVENLISPNKAMAAVAENKINATIENHPNASITEIAKLAFPKQKNEKQKQEMEVSL